MLGCFTAPWWKKSANDLEPWIRSTYICLACRLLGPPKLGLSEELRKVLLERSPSSSINVPFAFSSANGSYVDENCWLVQGVPRRPLYKELAYRLFVWSQIFNDTSGLQDMDQQEAREEDEDESFQFMVPASALNLTEESYLSHPVSPPESPDEIAHWLEHVDDAHILRWFGMRQTIGSTPGLIIPSPSCLLDASRKIHKKERTSKLTVAARARSKHAPRGKDAYFGIVTGTPEVQNHETDVLLQRMMRDAVWINCHKFGGLNEETTVAEIRVREGYGARWELQNTKGSSNPQKTDEILFRGFLEPQAKDGHERRWRL